jgi:hypothetical protein
MLGVLRVIDKKESLSLGISMMTVSLTLYLLLQNRGLPLLEWPNSGGVVKVVDEAYLEG